MTDPIRIGVLGAARVAPTALLAPAQACADVEVLAVGARDPERARTFAAEHGIPRVRDGYEAVITDPDLDAVYIPLPATVNAAWTIAAVRAGKHVLVEKPMAANAEDAKAVLAAATAADRVVVQGYHYRYHPFFDHLRTTIDRLGAVQSIRAWFTVPRPPDWNIRWRYELGGGTLMDHGSYPVHLIRSLTGTEPEVLSATAIPGPDPRNDGQMDLRLGLPGGCIADVHASMISDRLSIGAVVETDAGRIEVGNFIHPTMGVETRIVLPDGSSTMEPFETTRATFGYQLDAFVRAVRLGEPAPTGPEDGIANLTVIDAGYRAAGLPMRVPLADQAT